MAKIINNYNKGDYYSDDKITSLNAQYNLIYGERANGKSFAVKARALKNFFARQEECVLVRRYEVDIKRGALETYWQDMQPYISEWSDGKYNYLYCYAGDLYVCNRVDGKNTNAAKFGYARALSKAQSYSGGQYPNVTIVILEEYISLDGVYLPNELFLFTHLLSTISRRRDVVVYLLANSVSRLSPYWREYGVEDVIRTQKQGTIALIERTLSSGDVQTVAVEYCSNTAKRSKMFAANRDAMINGGKWLTQQQPHLDIDISLCDVLYDFVIEYQESRYYVRYMCYRDSTFLYVVPKTTSIQPNTRVISDTSNISHYYTRGLRPINQRERQIFEMLYNGKTFFCDNLTGTEFAECLRNLRSISI